MSKKYFVTSDIHGYFDIFHDALIRAGFDIENPDHILIVCGDIFDRGNQPLEVYNFLKNLPRERRVLVRGNHELLLQSLVSRGYPCGHDYHNKTYDTLYQLIGMSYKEEQLKRTQMWANMPEYGTPEWEAFTKEVDEKDKKRDRRLFHNRKISTILKWINSDEWVDYYELGPYIFVHAALPLTFLGENLWHPTYTLSPSWREMSWEEARWECPWKFYLKYGGSSELSDRILVCGHWHTSDFWNNLDLKDKKQMDITELNPIYLSEENPGLIGLDACTALTHGCNILVINEDMSCIPHNHKEFNIEEFSLIF